MAEGSRAAARRQPAQEPIQPPNSAAHESPISGDDLEVVELTDGDVQEAAENLRRRVADRRLRDELARNDFSGPAYRRFAEEIAAYGIAVCRAWLITGEMFTQCARRGYSVGPRPHHWGEHDVDSLTNMTVAQALREFRAKGLRDGHWREDGGASLKTYFVTACVYAFLNVHRAWRSEHTRWNSETTFEPADVALFDGPGNQDIADQALTSVEADRALAGRSDYQQQMLILRGLGYTHAEIGELLGRAPSAVERALHRIRLTAQRQNPGSGEVTK